MSGMDGMDEKGTTAIALPVLKELIEHADAGSREHELADIQRFLSGERYTEEEAYKVVVALGALDPDEFPFERCAKLLEGGVSAEMLPAVAKQAEALSERCGLSEGQIPLALSVFRDSLAEDGDVDKADIEHRLREALGDAASPEQTVEFLRIAERMMGEGRLGYPESLADFNRDSLSDASGSGEPDDDDEL